jgi:hypothetical protein
VAEVVGRKVGSCVLAMSGELSRRSVASATGIVSNGKRVWALLAVTTAAR